MSKIQEISKTVKPTTAVKAEKPLKVARPAKVVKAAGVTTAAKAVKPATAAKVAKPAKVATAVKPAKVAKPRLKSTVPAASFMPDALTEVAAPLIPEIAHGPVDSATFAEVIPAIPEEDLGLLPSRYDRNSLYAFPRDPERVFAVWELSGATRGGIGERALVITFRFGDGHKVVDMCDDVDIDLSHYYCAVPRGMLNVSVDLGMRTDTGTVTLMSFGPVGLAIAFERVSDAAFVKVDTTISLAGTSSDSRISAVSPAGVVPQTMMSQDGDAEARRAAFSDMPSSRGK